MKKRRGGDSNPRASLGGYTISSRAVSTGLTHLSGLDGPYIRGDEGAQEGGAEVRKIQTEGLRRERKKV